MMMDQAIDIEVPRRKIYRDGAVWVATFLGGPIAGGYLIAENFKVFGEISKVKKTWLFTGIITAVIFSCSIVFSGRLNSVVVRLIYTAIAYYLVQRFQGMEIRNHISSGGKLFSWLRTGLVGIIGFVISIILLFGFTTLWDYFNNGQL